MNKNILNLSRSPNSTNAADNDLSLTPHELNDLAIRIGADFGLPDINDINVGDESVNNDILVSVDQSQVTITDRHQLSNQSNANDVDMDTIVIETINEVDMSDAIVFDNVGNEVSISSSNPFDRQTSNNVSNVVTKSAPVPRRTRTGGPAKIRAPVPQQITHTIKTSQTPQPIRFSNQLLSAGQPQIIPFSSLNATHVLPTSVAIPKGQTKTKIVKKTTNANTSIQSIPTTDSSTLKVIYTSQGQQIVFSPSKQSNLSLNQTVIAPPGKVLLRPVGPNKMSTLNTSQPQQVIILSPVKANTSGVTPIAPATKILPIKSQPVIAAKSPQRVLAPAPTHSKIAISKTLTDSKPVQLIRVVPLSSVQTTQQVSSATFSSTFSSNKFVPLRPIAPNPSVKSIAPITQSTHKLLVPTSGVKTNASTLVTATTSSATFLTTTGSSNSGQVFMLPANSSLLKITPNTTSVSTTPSTKTVSFATTSAQRTNFVPIAPSPLTAATTASTLTAAQISSLKITNGSTKPEDPHQRKPCNCTKSQCLKLYCDCFANGEFCSSCNCISCHNNLDHEEERQKAIRQCLERNPHAFHPKIGKGRAGDTERRHTKGCNCRRSGCLKNYCECYEAKILCSGLCKCVGCKNFEESFERKTLMHLADAAEVRSAQQNVATKNRLWGSDFKPKLPIRVDGDRLPCSFITPEVVELTCQCLLAQAEQGEKGGLDSKQIETLVLEEFGRVLTQIIDCAAKNRNSKLKTECI